MTLLFSKALFGLSELKYKQMMEHSPLSLSKPLGGHSSAVAFSRVIPLRCLLSNQPKLAASSKEKPLVLKKDAVRLIKTFLTSTDFIYLETLESVSLASIFRAALPSAFNTSPSKVKN